MQIWKTENQKVEEGGNEKEIKRNGDEDKNKWREFVRGERKNKKEID